MPEILDAPINQIAFNPYRRLHAYPYVQSKLDALQRSITEVGLWPSVIARPLRGKLWKYELAFGHHRLEAARLSGLKTIPLIVEALSDQQMLQYMGRENLEDYNAVFLIQLESWEAATKSGLVRSTVRKEVEAVGVARLLGWTRVDRDRPLSLNATASACNAAFSLIEGGYMTREDFADLTVSAARDIAERALARIEQIDKVSKGSSRPARETERTKQYVGRGAADTAEQSRKGTVPQRDLRSRVDFNTSARAFRSSRPSPLFAVFANAVADNLKRSLQTDSDADKLAEIERVLGQISVLEDWEALRRLDVELLNLAKRAEGWQKRLIPSKEKIVQLQRLENKGA